MGKRTNVYSPLTPLTLGDWHHAKQIQDDVVSQKAALVRRSWCWRYSFTLK